MLKDLGSNLGAVWCSLMHESVMWPVHGAYECRTCGRRYPAFRETQAVASARHTALNPATLIALALAFAAAPHPVEAAGAIREPSHMEAEAALERYFSSRGTPAWPVETYELHASLPRLAKTGTLEAIRSVAEAGKVTYRAVKLTGDRTVEQQVIVRYLSAEDRTAQMPAASVAITPANYKFAYKGTVNDGERSAYVFHITPRKKRAGLIRGELWLDTATSLPIRRAGYLVKSPSIWIKRVAIAEEDSLRGGSVDSRLTRITVDARMVGRAELVIAEHPLATGLDAQGTGSESSGGQQ